MYQSNPTHLPDELHIPPVYTLLILTYNHNDDQRLLPQNIEPPLQPLRQPLSPRLDLAPS